MKKILLLGFIVQAMNIFSQPTIANFSPSSGDIGTTVTIIGTNFNTIAANNIVFFGATMATVSAASDTLLTVTVPFGASYQNISVTDVSTGLTAYSQNPFIVTFACGGVIVADTANNTSSFAPKMDVSTANQLHDVAVADLDGDSRPDIVVSNFNQYKISVFRNTSANGIISFASEVFFAAVQYPWGISLGDIDGDGKPDIVTGNYFSNTVSILRNTSTVGNISFAVRVDFTTGGNNGTVALSDLDGDGKPDIVSLNNNYYSFSVLRNTSTSGNISFAANVDFTTINYYPRSVAISDLDGDGKPDIVVVTDANGSDSTLSVFRNTSTIGSIIFAQRVDFTFGAVPNSIVTGDLDDDGKPDLALAISVNDSFINVNTVSVLRNTSTNGNISFAVKVDLSSGSSPGGIAINDVNGDSKPDLSVINYNTNIISVFKNTSTSGDISFGEKIDYATGPEPASVAICDMNEDGKSDLIVGNNQNYTVSILKNQVSPMTLTMTSNPSCSSGNNGSATVNINGGASPYSYLWNTTPVQTSNPAINLSVGNHTVTVTDNQGCQNQFNVTIIPLPQPLAPSICMVTVDSLSQHNVIMWDKTSFISADSFIVYREIGTNNYQPLGAVSYNELSLLVDTVYTQYFPNSGDPNAGTYRYKIAVKDSCGNISAFSTYHNTIFILNNNGAFSWVQPYNIGGTNPVISYILMRDDSSTGNWHAVNSVSGTQQTVVDPSYFTYNNTASWRVETQWNISCSPTMKSLTANYNTSLSNIYSTAITGIKNNNYPQITIYPNPGSGIYIIAGCMDNDEITIINILGDIVYESAFNRTEPEIDLSSQTKGVYFLFVLRDNKIVMKEKLIISN